MGKLLVKFEVLKMKLSLQHAFCEKKNCEKMLDIFSLWYLIS